MNTLNLTDDVIFCRRLKHPNIVRYHGSFECQRGIPGFILEAGLVRARQELFGFRSLPRRSKGKNVLLERCRRILEQVGMGLEYMHAKGLVHMELSLDTVMVGCTSIRLSLYTINPSNKNNLLNCIHAHVVIVCFPRPVERMG